MSWHELFIYDENQPSCLLRRKRNEKVGWFSGGYYHTEVDNIPYMCHRIIWEMFNGEIPDNMFVDHIDRIKSNNRIDNLRLVTREGNMRNARKSSNNKSGVTGVMLHDDGRSHSYWKAKWRNLDGTEGHKFFSIKKLGYEEAFKLACEYRQTMIQCLNSQGAGYTERHGT